MQFNHEDNHGFCICYHYLSIYAKNKSLKIKLRTLNVRI